MGSSEIYAPALTAAEKAALDASPAATYGYATLNVSTKVVQDPANATQTAAENKIPIAKVGGKVDDWVTQTNWPSTAEKAALPNIPGVYANVTAAKAETAPKATCYVIDKRSYYEYVAEGGAYVADDVYILQIGAGNQRWVAVAGDYKYMPDNIRLGAYAGQNLNAGVGCLAFGLNSLQFNVTGVRNTAIGVSALQGVTGNSHTDNTAVGFYAGYSITTATLSTLVGSYAGKSITSGSKNCFFGVNSGFLVTTGTNNVAIGHDALYPIAASAGAMANNIAIGADTLGITGAGWDGNGCIAIGVGVMSYITGTALSNCSLGYRSSFALTTAQKQSAFGDNALYFNQTGNGNSAFGTQAMYGVTTKSPVVCCSFGRESLFKIEGATGVTAMGYQAGYNHATGNYGTYFGYQAGLNFQATSASNVCIGPGAGPAALTTASNTLYIHNAASDTPLIHGDFSTGLVTINTDLKTTKFGIGLTPIATRTHVADAAGGTEIATINAILATLEAFGLHAAA